MAFPLPFHRGRPHPWHGLEAGPAFPGPVNAHYPETFGEP